MRLLAWKELELIGVIMRYRLDMFEVSAKLMEME